MYALSLQEQIGLMRADGMQGKSAEAPLDIVPQAKLQKDAVADAMPLLDAAC